MKSANRTAAPLWLRAAGWSLAVVLLHTAAQAQGTSTEWVLGGAGGEPWARHALRWIALDDSTRQGAVQPREILPGQNVLRERVRSLGFTTQRNIFGYKWSFNKGRVAMEADTLLVGWHPRVWRGGGTDASASNHRGLVDGDELTPAFTHNPPGDGRPSSITWFTLDLGIPVAVDSVAFFPPQNGLDPNKERFRDLFARGYEVSRTNIPVDWLIFEDETEAAGSAGYHPLDDILASTLANNNSVVGLNFGLRFTRFLRLRFGGVTTSSVVGEIQVFGRGFPAEARYLSLPQAFDQPVSFGKITWKFTKYRQALSGEVFEDPAAPVEFVIRTRAGTDPDPQAYFIFDELTRPIEVDREGYYDARPAGLNMQEAGFRSGGGIIPGTRSAVTDDIEDWNGWSIAYPKSGEEIRSSDGREYLQFRFEITTGDPLTFGVLDSLAFEISPLLADSVIAEISLEGQPDKELVEVPLGVDTVFVYDMRTVFGSGNPGFDGIELDVPAGAELLELEIDGEPAVEGEEYELLSAAADDRLSFAFSRRFEESTSFRFRFRSAIFQTSAFFSGRVLDRDPRATALPQSIESGDARPDVASDQILVVASQERLKILGALRLSTPVITPNGDAVNDAVVIDFDVFGVVDAQIEVEVYDLQGRSVVALRQGTGSAGQYRPTWDGRDGENRLVPPGIYIVRVEADVDKGTFAEFRAVSVAY